MTKNEFEHTLEFPILRAARSPAKRVVNKVRAAKSLREPLQTGRFPMSMEKTEGVVIRLADFSETSRVVTFFTRDFGRISALAKGGKRLKGPFEAALDLLAQCRIVFLRKSAPGLDLLTEAKLTSRFKPSGRELDRFYGGYYVAELLSGLTEEADPHPKLYHEAIDALTRLQETNPKVAIIRFELAILREIGQLPALDVCVNCGRPADGEGTWVFSAAQGGLICPNCEQESISGDPISAGTAAVLRRLSEESDAVVERLALSARQLREARQVVTAAIAHALGRPPKMLRYIST
jgi:DNA repair protein RecO (recombination protein O)